MIKTKIGYSLKIAVLSAAALTSISVPAQAFDIDRWLRDTFSTTDYVGEWMKDTFGPVHDSSNGSPSPKTALPGYKDAVMTMEKWEKPRRDEALKLQHPTVRRICSDETLLSVIVETQSKELTQRICFKTTSAEGKPLGEALAIEHLPLRARPMQRR